MRDQLNNADPVATARAAMAALDKLQEYRKAEQVMGLAATFILFCETQGLRPTDVMETASNVMRDQEDIGWRAQFRAIKRYIREEL